MTPFVVFLFLFQAGPADQARVRATVSDPSGRPIEGAQAVCAGQTRFTDSQGAIAFPAPCTATVTKDGFAEQSIALTTGGDASITLALAPKSERVVVTATGAPIALENAGVAAQVFTSPDFEPSRGAFVQNLLRDVPGLSIVQSGGNGGITSLFARGGNSNGALVLLDGVPVNEPGGSLDFAHLTSPGLDRMEVVRGPESTLFGAEAPSAVIQIFTHHGDAESTRPHATLTYERGSFDTDHWTGLLDGGLAKRIDYSFTADQFRSTGEFPNNAWRITSGTANVGFAITEATRVRAVFREFDSSVGTPGQAFYGLYNLDSHEFDRDSAVSVRLDDQRGRRFTQHVIYGFHRYRDRYSDAHSESYKIAGVLQTLPNGYTYLVSQVPYNSSVSPPSGAVVVNKSVTLFANSGFTLTDRTNAAYQGAWTQARGTLVFGYDYQRQAGIISATDVSRHDNGFFVHEQYSLTSRIFLTGGARLEQSNTFGTKFAPRGAITFRLPTETYLRVSLARGIKEPALIENFAKETYYVGNPGLRPEKTDSFEAGLFRDWIHSRLRTEVSYFRNLYTDLIQYDSSKFPGSWTNLKQAWARGAEVSATLRLPAHIDLRAAYTRLQTHDPTAHQLLRRPRNSGSIALQFTPRHWTVAAGARVVGESADNDFVFNVTRNPGYHYVFANASWQAMRHLAPFVRIDNALAETYQEALGYQALSRTAFGGVRVSW